MKFSSANILPSGKTLNKYGGKNRMKDRNSSERQALLYRWVVWGIAVLAYMVVFFHRLAAGVVREDLVEAFGLSASAFGTLASMYFYAYMVMQIPVGIMADSLGARKTISAGIVVAGIGSLIFGLAPSVSIIFLARFLVGIGVSTVFVSILKLQSQWFREREFATMSGMTAFLGNLGGVLAQAPLAFMVTLFTWRMTFAGIGVFSLVLASGCYLFIRNRPQDMGFAPINEAQILQEDSLSDENTKVNLGSAIREVVSQWQIWPAFLYFGLVSGAFLAFAGAWGVSFMGDVYGMDKTSASNYVSFAIYGAMAGGIMTGWVSDRLRKRKLPLVVNTILVALLWGMVTFMNGGKPPVEILKPLFFVLGFSSTAFILSLAIIKETNSPRFTGIAISVLNTGCFVGTAFVTTVMGLIIDISSSAPAVTQYQRAFLLCLAGSVIGVICTLLLPETGCRNIYMKSRREVERIS
jgi:sugar phosphate permease